MTKALAIGWIIHFQTRIILSKLPNPIHVIYLDLLIRYACELTCKDIKDKICEVIKYLDIELPIKCKPTVNMADPEVFLIGCNFYQLEIRIFYFLTEVIKNESDLKFENGKYYLDINKLLKESVPQPFWTTTIAFQIRVKYNFNDNWVNLYPLQNIVIQP